MRQPRTTIEPRLLTAEQAASYLGYATTGVLAAIPVKPVQMATTGPGSQLKYDRAALDAWLDQLSGISVPPKWAASANNLSETPEAAYERWQATRSPG